jgi:hypothetical protein
MQSGVDHFHAGITQGERYDFGAAIMSVQSGFANQYFYLLFCHFQLPYFFGIDFSI